MSSCTAAMQTHALTLAIEASKSFARRRFRLSQARVRFDDPSVTRSNKRARSDGSLWRKMCFSARLLRMPAIIEAWLKASENTTMTTILRARVDRVASLAT